MTTPRVLAAIVAGLVVGTLTVGRAEALTYTGCLTANGATECTLSDGTTRATDGELGGAGDWAVPGTIDLYLGWVVSGADSNWTYSYTFFHEQAPSIGNVSHAVVEVSPTFTIANVLSTSGDCSSSDGSVGTQTPSGTSGDSPNLPSSFYGFKCNTSGFDSNLYTLTFTSDRAPIWGDWYAKDGGATAVWNAGFTGTDVDPPLDAFINSGDAPANYLFAQYQNHVLVPDTTTTVGDVPVPEPGSLMLLGSGLVGLGAGLRSKLRWTKTRRPHQLMQ